MRLISPRGILRKDDPFKVVFDPGSDKREDRILGPVFSPGEDTGGSAARQMQQQIDRLNSSSVYLEGVPWVNESLVKASQSR